jgi:hypothetical protein
MKRIHFEKKTQKPPKIQAQLFLKQAWETNDTLREQ